MAYIDQVGKYLTFERKNSDGIADAEHVTAVCPQCSKVATGKAKGRSESGLASLFKWVVLPGKPDMLYCSYQCAQAHNPQGCKDYLLRLDAMNKYIILEIDSWYRWT